MLSVALQESCKRTNRLMITIPGITALRALVHFSRHSSLWQRADEPLGACGAAAKNYVTDGFLEKCTGEASSWLLLATEALIPVHRAVLPTVLFCGTMVDSQEKRF